MKRLLIALFVLVAGVGCGGSPDEIVSPVGYWSYALRFNAPQQGTCNFTDVEPWQLNVVEVAENDWELGTTVESVTQLEGLLTCSPDGCSFTGFNVYGIVDFPDGSWFNYNDVYQSLELAEDDNISGYGQRFLDIYQPDGSPYGTCSQGFVLDGNHI